MTANKKSVGSNVHTKAVNETEEDLDVQDASLLTLKNKNKRKKPKTVEVLPGLAVLFVLQ